MDRHGPKRAGRIWSESDLVRVPRLFYEDHLWRDLPTPPAIKERVHHVWIEPDHPDLPELLNDAEYYAHPYGPDIEDSFSRNLANSAQKTVDSIRGVS